jgi:hypothetical protein
VWHPLKKAISVFHKSVQFLQWQDLKVTLMLLHVLPVLSPNTTSFYWIHQWMLHVLVLLAIIRKYDLKQKYICMGTLKIWQDLTNFINFSQTNIALNCIQWNLSSRT